MIKKIILITLMLAVLPVSASLEYTLPAMDTATLKQQTRTISGPLKYAVTDNVNDIYKDSQETVNGEWQTLANGQQQYRIRISAKNATSLNVGMQDFFLPPTAELWVSNDDKSILRGPYTDRYNPQNGYFWIGDVPGDHVNLKITVSPAEKAYLSFDVTQIAKGFYEYWKTPTENGLKSGSCNVDVACPEGDDWGPEISSVGQYSFTKTDGSFVCTGQLINNTAQDGKPYFLTASHCGYTGSSNSERNSIAASLNIIWNYESQTCRTPGSGSSGTAINKGTFNQRQSGATYVASNANSDFSLLLLNQTPAAQFDVNYTGWDRSDTAFDSGIGIHHPSGHAKRISFENEPLKITGYLQSNGGGTTHLRVVDWDTGTTEGGSSGSGLWNSDYRLVGQLHGGYAACGNNSSDWYGRFYKSWNTGSTPQSRLKDWLDPIDSGQITLNSTDRCQAPSIEITTPNSPQVGGQLTFSAQVSGGSGNYSYAWDINGDGYVDGTGATIKTRYHQAYIGNITLTVKDNTGCQGVDSKAVIIKAADIQIDGNPILTQQCGNNDNVFDPGERWRAQVTTRNIGNKTATAGYLMLDNKTNQVSDNFGNTSKSCDSEFIDITNSGTRHNWTLGPVSGTTADDEGYAKIQLAQSFMHYGQTVSSLVASTNGYLNTDPNANGIDWTNDCPLPATADKDAVGGRIAAMHADLNSSVLYHQSFNDCPRDAESGDNLACEVFLWKGAYFYNTAAIDSMNIQAILYPATSQWAFQYQGPGIDGSTATVGIQNSAADDGLTYACNTPNSLSTQQAVCVFNKTHPDQSNDSRALELETPAVYLGNMAVNASKAVNVDFSISEDAVCGSNLELNHTASVFDEGFNAGQAAVVEFEVGNNSQCQTVTQCEVDSSNSIKPENGLWWNPKRSGNGIDMHIFNDDRLLYTMYTGLPDRTPVWYTADGDDSAFNQYYSQIAHVSSPGGYQPGNLDITLAGWSNTIFLTSKKAIQVREINSHLSAEKLILDEFDLGFTSNNHTGHYYAPNQSGWGESVITRGQKRIIINYIYDLAGNPYWTIASGFNDNSVLTAAYADTFCPHCPSVPFEAKAVGEIQMQFNGNTDGVIKLYDINDPANNAQPGAKWNRSQLPVTNLIPQAN